MLRIEKLQRGHNLDPFDCGREALNRFLIRYAFQNQQAGASQTYIALADDEVAGYYTLVVGQVENSAAPERLTKGLARYPVPIMLLARLAVAVSWQCKGLGGGPPYLLIIIHQQPRELPYPLRVSNAPQGLHCLQANCCDDEGFPLANHLN